jgi:kynurenine formamidase
MRLFLNDSEFIETQHGEDLSIELTKEDANPRAWYVDYPKIEPVRANGFVGSVAEGGGVNFRDISFNPHGHGTHTECYGHISREWVSVNDCLQDFWFKALLVTVKPENFVNAQYNEIDKLITLNQLKHLDLSQVDALIVRTQPNDLSKKSKNYSASNPPYFEGALADWLVNQGINHFLVDLPSVDREVDGGILDFHHRFWCYPKNPRKQATITEFVYVSNEIPDGVYALNLQVAAFNNDAAPSRPVLYPIERL